MVGSSRTCSRSSSRPASTTASRVRCASPRDSVGIDRSSARWPRPNVSSGRSRRSSSSWTRRARRPDRKLLDELEDLAHRTGQQLGKRDAGDAVRRRVRRRRRNAAGSSGGPTRCSSGRSAPAARACRRGGPRACPARRRVRAWRGPRPRTSPACSVATRTTTSCGAAGSSRGTRLDFFAAHGRPSIVTRVELAAQPGEQTRVTARVGHARPPPPRRALSASVEHLQRDREPLLARHRPHRHGAARAGDVGEAGVEDAQERVQADRRRDRRRGVAVQHVLRDRHRRSQPLDAADVRGRHPHPVAAERERLHEPAARLGVDHVERQRRLPRPRHADDGGQPRPEASRRRHAGCARPRRRPSGLPHGPEPNGPTVASLGRAALGECAGGSRTQVAPRRLPVCVQNCDRRSANLPMCGTRNRRNAKQLRADSASRSASRGIANAKLQVGGGEMSWAAWTRKRCEAFLPSHCVPIDARRLSVARIRQPGQGKQM